VDPVPDQQPDQPEQAPRPAPADRTYPVSGLARVAFTASWVAGLTLALSVFMGWYSSSDSESPTISVLGWNTGTVGKLVFVLGLAVILLALGRVLDIELPRALPESLILIVLGTAATVLLLIRIISIPDEFAGTSNRAIGLWVGLASAVVVILAGLVRAGEEL
jgi:hypothetical protein